MIKIFLQKILNFCEKLFKYITNAVLKYFHWLLKLFLWDMINLLWFIVYPFNYFKIDQNLLLLLLLVCFGFFCWIERMGINFVDYLWLLETSVKPRKLNLVRIWVKYGYFIIELLYFYLSLESISNEKRCGLEKGTLEHIKEVIGAGDNTI